MAPRSWIRRLFARPPRTVRKAPARRLALEALETRLVPAYLAATSLTGADNPWNGADVGEWSTPALGDVDGDGDLDAVVGKATFGTLVYFKNTGSATSPVYQEQDADNPFDDVSVGSYSAPALGDVDADGDLDLVMGTGEGTLVYFKNTGTAASPVYEQQQDADNPWGGIDVGDYSIPSLGDVDGDGDLDLVVGESHGTLVYFKNTGSATTPVYQQQQGAANPLGGIRLVSYPTPALGDLDGDGDLDLVVGNSDDFTVRYFKNAGSATRPVYVEQQGA